MKRILAAVAVLLLSWSYEASAAKNAYVLGKDAVLRGAPNQTSDVLGPLVDGEPIEVSNFPTAGFYKVRTSSGQIGWIDATTVSFDEPLPEPSSPAPAPAASPAATEPALDEDLPAAPSFTPEAQPSAEPSATVPPTAEATIPEASPSPEVTTTEPVSAVPAPQPTPTEAPYTPVPYEDVENAPKPVVETPKSAQPKAEKAKLPKTPSELKIFVGDQNVSLGEVNQALGYGPISWVPYFGVQAGFPIVNRLRFLGRLEYLSKSTAADNGLNFNVQSVPLMGGISYSIAEDEKQAWSVEGAMLLGAAIHTAFQVTNPALPQPNTTEIESTSFTEMLKLDLNVKVADATGLYFETGYRFLKTSSEFPTAGLGSSVFQPNGAGGALPLDLSGVFFGGGIQFLF